jgi:hypothetical protein
MSSRCAESLRRVEAEIRRAKAEALGRLGERLDAVLHDLAERDRRLDRLLEAGGAGAGHPQVPRVLEERNQLREQARQLVHHLIIQREAIGLVGHGAVLERYAVPPRRWLDPAET